MEFIRKHKFTTCTISVLLIIIILAFAIFRFLIPNYGGDLYGNRLSGISSYKIDDTKVSEMKDVIGKLEGVTSVEYILEGKLIDIVIRVEDGLERDVAKGYADQALTYFSDEEKGYYDAEVMLTSDNENSEKYPIIGYKHKTSEVLVWSNNQLGGMYE